MSWLDDFLIAVKRVRDGSGRTMPQRNALKFGAGFTVTDDATRNELVVSLTTPDSGATSIDVPCVSGLGVGQAARLADVASTALAVPAMAGTFAPAIGVVKAKASPTLCTVTLLGPLDVSSGSVAGPVYVGADGYLTTELPAGPAMAQQMGVANGAGQVIVQPLPAVWLLDV